MGDLLTLPPHKSPSHLLGRMWRELGATTGAKPAIGLTGLAPSDSVTTRLARQLQRERHQPSSQSPAPQRPAYYQGDPRAATGVRVEPGKLLPVLRPATQCPPGIRFDRIHQGS